MVENPVRFWKYLLHDGFSGPSVINNISEDLFCILFIHSIYSFIVYIFLYTNNEHAEIEKFAAKYHPKIFVYSKMFFSEISTYYV